MIVFFLNIQMNSKLTDLFKSYIQNTTHAYNDEHKQPIKGVDYWNWPMAGDYLIRPGMLRQEDALCQVWWGWNVKNGLR